MEFEPAQPCHFTVKLRIPPQAGEITLRLNGRVLPPDAHSDDHLELDRTWSRGDQLSLGFDIAAGLRSFLSPDYGVLVRGPEVLAIDQRDNQGAWVSAGSYPTRDGFIEFRLDNQGSGSAYVAAQTVSISCHP